MRTTTIILAAVALVLTAAGPAMAACGSPLAVQVGEPSRDPEKATFGLVCGSTDVGRTSSITGSARNVGANTGDAEKDTLGYLQTAAAQ